MPPLMSWVGLELDNFVDLLILLTWQRIPGILDIPFHGIPVMLLWSYQGPWVWGHCSFTWGHLMSSIASVLGGFVPFGHRIGYSHSRMDGFVGYSGMGSAVHGLSIIRYCRSFGGLGLHPRLSVSVLGR